MFKNKFRATDNTRRYEANGLRSQLEIAFSSSI